MVATVHTNMSVVESDGNAASLSAYGNARHHRAADITGNGGVDGADQLALLGSWGSYGVGDLNRDGVVDGADMLIMQANWGGARVAGELSQTDNIIGYAGYIFNAELVFGGSMSGGGLYTVRHRHYAPDLGRWLSRDPIGYVDGMSLYEYVRGRPLRAFDPYGLSEVTPEQILCEVACAAACWAACFGLTGPAAVICAVGCTFACGAICSPTPIGPPAPPIRIPTGDECEFQTNCVVDCAKCVDERLQSDRDQCRDRHNKCLNARFWWHNATISPGVPCKKDASCKKMCDSRRTRCMRDANERAREEIKGCQNLPTSPPAPSPV